MYAQAAIKRNIIPRNGAYRIVNRDVHFCTPPCSSLRSKDYTSLGRITLDTATDPCMGSGHILVYAFDVLMQIYESCGYTQRDAARSIMENNIYGIDIDKRAYQLAYFAVMMKARQYDRRFLSRDIQPHVYAIKESNDINRKHLDVMGAGMSDSERDNAKAQLIAFLDAMADAREYGSILNIDNYDWDLLRRFVSETAGESQISMEYMGAEQTVLQLQDIINVGEALAQKYEVVCTNPPYMGGSGMNAKLSTFVKKNYPDSKSDMFAVFIERCGQMTAQNGYQAMITQHAWMFLSSFEKLRDKLLNTDIVNMAHLGARAFEEIGGEVVQTTSFVMRKSSIADYKGTYCRLIEPNTQQGKEDMFLAGNNRYIADQTDFFKIPGSPVAYWVSEKIYSLFAEKETLGNFCNLKVGISTADNARFVRLWYEVDINNMQLPSYDKQLTITEKKWFPFNNGGLTRRWYGNNIEVINWENNGEEIISTGRASIRNKKFYLQKGATWTDISTGKIGVRLFYYGYIFSTVGLCMFSENHCKYLTALLNSPISVDILRILCPTLHFNIGDIANMPVIVECEDKVIDVVDKCEFSSRTDWDSYETSWDFKQNPLVGFSGSLWDATAIGASMSYYYGEPPKVGSPLELCYMLWKGECEERFKHLKANEEELNRIFIDIYGLQDELTPDVADKDVTVHRVFDTKDDVPDSMNGSNYVRTMRDEIVSFISYAVGCMLGRYSLNAEGLAYAGGEWDSSKYRTFIPDADNCIPITDEEYFEDDIVGFFCDWLKKVYGEDTLEENLDFIAKALGNKGKTSREIIRNYFLNDFIKDHIKTYKKRPIYWLFDSGKKHGFKALVYMHRWNADTIGNVRVEYLHRIQRVYEKEILRMQEIIDNSPDNKEIAKAAKRKEKLQKQLKEAQDYDAKIAHLALSRIDIDLDDGVKVNYEKVQTVDGKKIQILVKI